MMSREAALAYLSRGLSVLPLHTPVGSGCSLRKGHSMRAHRQASPHRLDKFPDVPPNREGRARLVESLARIGIITGMISGLAGLDVDGRNGGFETLVEL